MCMYACNSAYFIDNNQCSLFTMYQSCLELLLMPILLPLLHINAFPWHNTSRCWCKPQSFFKRVHKTQLKVVNEQEVAAFKWSAASNKLDTFHSPIYYWLLYKTGNKQLFAGFSRKKKRKNYSRKEAHLQLHNNTRGGIVFPGHYPQITTGITVEKGKNIVVKQVWSDGHSSDGKCTGVCLCTALRSQSIDQIKILAVAFRFLDGS